MDKKFYGSIGAVIVIIITLGGYCLFANNNSYYENYRLQSACTESTLELSINAMTPFMLQMFGNSCSLFSHDSPSTQFKTYNLQEASKNATNSLEKARNNATLAHDYQQKMQRCVNTDSEKKYAEILINQSLSD